MAAPTIQSVKQSKVQYLIWCLYPITEQNSIHEFCVSLSKQNTIRSDITSEHSQEAYNCDGIELFSLESN